MNKYNIASIIIHKKIILVLFYKNVEKHEESGDDWSAKYIKVELDSGRKVTFQTAYPSTYEQYCVNGAIQLYVWEVPFGFEIACLAEVP